ncbi:MAG: hypothetical protein AB1324_02290 [Candidatus Micrarchaeota archaeon]
MRLKWKPPELKTTVVLTEFALESRAAGLLDAILRRVTVEMSGVKVVSVLKLANDPKNGQIRKAIALLDAASRCETVEEANRLIPLLDMAMAGLE